MKLACEFCKHEYETKPGYYHECRIQGRVHQIFTGDLWGMLLDRLCLSEKIINKDPEKLRDLWLVHKDGRETQMGTVSESIEWLRLNWENVHSGVE